jgi:drug/metabolite transporter (DMT)-like permease
MMRSNHRLLPVGSLLVSATLWGLVWIPLRLLDGQGMGGLWASLTSYGAALLVGLFWLSRRAPSWHNHGLALACMALAVGWCNVAFVLAVLDGTVVRVLLLFYLSPLWTLILGWLILDERPGREGLLVFIVAVIGALTMLWDPSMGMPWPRDQADWLAVSSGFAFAVANVLVRHQPDVPVSSKVIAGWLGDVLVAAVWILVVTEPLPTVAAPVWLGAVLLGWFGFMIMTVLVVYGVTHMPVHRSAVILLFELVVGTVSALLLTDEQVEIREWLGGGLIVLAAYGAAHAQIGESA